MKLIRYIPILAVLFFLSFNSESGESISSTPTFRNALDKSEAFFSEGDYKSAEKWAEKAFAEAIKSENINNQARAAYRAGLAIGEQEGIFARNRAIKKFEECINLSSDAKIQIAAYQELRAIANKRSRSKEVESYSAAIALLKANISAQKATKQSRNAAKNSRAQTRQMTEALEKMSSEQEDLAATISQLSLQQTQNDLLLARQKSLLDSLSYDNLMDSLELQSKDFLLQSPRAELREQAAFADLAKTQRRFFLALAIIGLLLAVGLFYRYRATKKYSNQLEDKNNQIVKEKARANELLLNILPEKVALELINTGKASPQHFEQATVLFTDFEGFSQIAKQLSPQELVEDLDSVFKEFDAIVGNYGIEKIKTIGDAYMCAGGLPETKSRHPQDLINAALDIQVFLKEWNIERARKNKPAFRARIGIHTGPIVAGVVGTKKFAYDIWGDTVNIAARLETAGEVGKVNISQNTYDCIKDDFKTEQRGKLPVKNLGEVRMYFVSR